MPIGGRSRTRNPTRRTNPAAKSAGGGQKPDQKQDSGGGQSAVRVRPMARTSSNNRAPAIGPTQRRQQGWTKDSSPRQQDPSKSGNDAKTNEKRAWRTEPKSSPASNRRPAPAVNPQGGRTRKIRLDQPQDSDTKSDTGGDRSGHGGQGGDQPGRKARQGSRRPRTLASDDGGATANEKGPGRDGTKAGDQVKSDQSTGSAKQEAGHVPRNRKTAGREKARPASRSSPPTASPEAAGANKTAPTAAARATKFRPARCPRRAAIPPPAAGPAIRPTPPRLPAVKERGADEANLEFQQRNR